MYIEKDSAYYREAISRCRENIEYVKHSNFPPKEKRDLKKAYEQQITLYTKKLKSFFEPA